MSSIFLGLRSKAVDVGKAHAEIWWAHDERAWKRLSLNAQKLLELIGYQGEQTKCAARHIRKAYQYSDYAVIAQKKGNSLKERKYYGKAYEEAKLVRQLLKDEVLSVKFEVLWWEKFRHKQYILTSLLMLLQHLVKLKFINFPAAFYSTFYYIKAGFCGHNKKSRSLAEKYLIKYWEIILLTSYPKTHIEF